MVAEEIIENAEMEPQAEEKKVRGSNFTPAGNNPHTLFRKGKISRGEYIKRNRQEKKERKDKRREKLGLPKHEPTFDLNNEKIWFKQTYKQTKSHLMNQFVKKLKSFRFVREKLEKTDVTNLTEPEQKAIAKKKQRCVKGEQYLEKEMYLIKSWTSDQVFNMMIEHEPIKFDTACDKSLESGDMSFRARERIRNYKLVAPVWEKINRELQLFDQERAIDQQSKSKQLSETISDSTKLDKADAKEHCSETSNDRATSQDQDVETTKLEKKQDAHEEDARFNLDAFQKVAKLVETETAKSEEQEPEGKKGGDENGDEVSDEEFKEYSSDEEDNEQEPVDNSHIEDDAPYEITFALPKGFDQKVKDTKSSNDFFTIAEKDEEMQDSSSDESNISEEEDDDQQAEALGKPEALGGFFLQDNKPVSIKSKAKKVVKKANKNNREGQWERKRHAKAVYGKHAQDVTKEEQARKAKKEKKAEKWENKKRAAEKSSEMVHPSWNAAKKAKEQANIKQFKGTKITFDDSD